MSRLEEFARHCRRMANAAPSDRVKASWTPGREPFVRAVGPMTRADRAMWRDLAGEAERQLWKLEQASMHDPEDRTPHPDDQPLC